MSKTTGPVRTEDTLNPGAVKQKGASFSQVAQVKLKGEQAKDFKGTLRRMLAMLRPSAVKISAALLLTVMSTAFAVISPILLAKITTALQVSVRDSAPFDMALLPEIAGVLIALYLLSWGFDIIRRRIMINTAQNLIFGLRREVDEKLGRLPLSFFDKYKTGDVMSRATNDIENIAVTVQSSLDEFAAAAVTVVGIAAAMLAIDPLITLVCVVTIPLGTLITVFIVRRSQRYFRRQAGLLGEMNSFVEESCTGHRIIKIFGGEKEQSARYDETSGEYCRAASKAQYASGFTYPLTSLVNELSYVAICFIGGLKVLSGTMMLGDIQALIHYSQKVSNPVTVISNMMSTVQTAAASAERIFELLDEQEQEPDGPCDLKRPVRGEVRLHNVSFSYDGTHPVVENLSLEAQPGSVIAIVGHTGSGKTTLVNLIMRFYEPQSGSITIDGQDLRGITRQSLYGSIGMVLQDTWLFEGTVAENIAYGAEHPENVSRRQVEDAARTAMADAFIRALPNGYETVIGGEKETLSQGQKQLITIARAVLASPDILILDEATSGVDTRTEQLIQKAMERMMKGRTCFIIAHRLSTIRHAQSIVVMQDGRIAETGSHEELIARRGRYWELYNSQFVSAREENGS